MNQSQLTSDVGVVGVAVAGAVIVSSGGNTARTMASQQRLRQRSVGLPGRGGSDVPRRVFNYAKGEDGANVTSSK